MPRPQPLVHQGVRCSSGRSRETIVLRDRFSLVQISYRSICHNCCSSNLSKRNKKPDKEGFVFCAGMKVDRSTPITIYSTGKDVSAFFRHLVHFCKPKRRSSLRCRSSSLLLFYSLSLFLSLSLPFRLRWRHLAKRWRTGARGAAAVPAAPSQRHGDQK